MMNPTVVDLVPHKPVRILPSFSFRELGQSQKSKTGNLLLN